MTTVVGRDRELEEVAAFLGADADGARVLVLDGEPGIGKTTLWRDALRLANAGGYRVLTSSPGGAETELAFTGLRDLLGAVFDEIAGDLPPPQRRALAVALLRDEPGDEPPEPATVSVALLSGLRRLATDEAVAIGVDDVQWLDAASAAALQYALRRLMDVPIVFVLSRRTNERDVLELDRLEPDRVRVLELRGLTVGALGRILHDQLAKTFTRPTLQRMHEVSGGNALYALEIARALGDSPTPGPLPVPRTLRELVEDRLTALPQRTFEALLVVASLSRPTVELVSAALADDPAPVLRPAIDARIIDVDGATLSFAHPLFAAAVYGLGGLQRTQLHATLARVVTDPEERARHLALATLGPDDAVARVLDQGAAAAFARGSPAAAAELAAHAVRLTPSEDAAVPRRLAEAEYHFAGGDTARAAALLAEAVAVAPPGAERARVLSEQARVEHFATDMPTSLEIYRRALAEAGSDALLAAEIETGITWRMVLTRVEIARAVEHGRSAVELALTTGRADLLAEAWAARALAEFVAGRPHESSLAAALALEDAVRQVRVLRHPTLARAYILASSDELGSARAAFLELVTRADSGGDENAKSVLFNHLAEIECQAGRFAEAAAYADDGQERARESGHAATRASVLGKKALLAVRQGRLDDAEAHARSALAISATSEFDPSHPEHAIARGAEGAIWSLGVAAQLRGQLERADGLLQPLCRAVIAAGVAEPGEARALPDAIEGLAALGRDGEAELLLAEFESWAGRVRRASVSGLAARCRGVLEHSLEELEAAVAWHADAQLPFEHGRSLLALGTQQRRARRRRDARETLVRALGIFDELGAELMAQHTRDELGRIGGRAPSAGELTATERRVAELVAAGKKNKEVADALVVSIHTVEATLTRIYQKLDVRSRTELAAQLSKQ